MKVEILKYRVFERNTLQGFCEISFMGLHIRDCTHHEKNDQEWISLPSKNYRDDQGNVKYYALIQFEDKADHLKFQDASKEALQEHFAKEKATGTDGELPF